MKKLAVIFVFLLILVTLAGTLSACSGKKQLVGAWELVDEEGDEEAELVLADNGTGTMKEDGMSANVTWSVSGNKLTLTISVCGESETTVYKYSVHGKTLKLISVDDPDDVVVWKKK